MAPGRWPPPPQLSSPWFWQWVHLYFAATTAVANHFYIFGSELEDGNLKGMVGSIALWERDLSASEGAQARRPLIPTRVAPMPAGVPFA